MSWTRRKFLALPAALAAAPKSFRLALCNETFQGVSFEETCRGARRTGYTGVEIAPFTMSEDPASLPAARRAEFRRMMQSEGVAYVGLHSLLTVPKGLHLTTPDAALRRKSWDYMLRLIDLSGDLGEGGIVVFGMSRQRSTTGGATVAEAVGRVREGLAEMAPAAAARRTTIVLEPLAPHLSDVVNTIEEAVAIVRQINHPGLQAMFDTHNAAAEKPPHGDVIRKFAPYIRHVHLNEMDGRYPGSGAYDFGVVLQALRDVSYDRWVSVEVFDFKEGGDHIATESARLVRRLEAGLR